jgi:hypothetical protein
MTSSEFAENDHSLLLMLWATMDPAAIGILGLRGSYSGGDGAEMG